MSDRIDRFGNSSLRSQKTWNTPQTHDYCRGTELQTAFVIPKIYQKLEALKLDETDETQ